MAMAKPAPAKPVPAKPVPAKPAPAKPAPAKPAPVAAKPAPAKPAPAAPKPAPKPAPVAAKPAAAAPRPAAPAPKAAPEFVSKADFEAFQKQCAELFEAHSARMDKIQVDLVGYGEYVSIGENGEYVLNIDEAPREILRDWAWQFGLTDLLALETEALRAGLLKQRASKKGFVAVNEGSAPAEEEAPAEAEAEAEAEGGEEETITEEAINKMNWSGLTALAARCGIDFADISKPPNPKTLRARIIEFLSSAGGEEEGAAEEEGGQLVEGETHVLVTVDGESYPGTFMGVDADGDYVVAWDADGEQVAVPADSVSLG